jgi:hypothetical protein
MTTLSPDAQSVMEAYWDTPNHPVTTQIHQAAVAAALRAVADQVVPDQRGDGVYLTGTDYHRWDERKLIRRQLLAIANQLEGAS